MDIKKIEFSLPIGYEDENGNYHREGIMKMATALTEIEVNNDERIVFNPRYRDCLILSKVITKLGELPSIEPETIEGLFEVDFLYLQLLYNKLNKDFNEVISTQCPECNQVNQVYLPDLYTNIHHYFAEMRKNTEENSQG